VNAEEEENAPEEEKGTAGDNGSDGDNSDDEEEDEESEKMMLLREFELYSQYICTFCMVPSNISEIVCFVLQVGEFCVSFKFSKSYLYQIVLLQYHFWKHIVTKLYYYDLTNPLCIITISNISRKIDYVPNEKFRSYIAPRYAELVGPVLVRWKDYHYGEKKLIIGEYPFTRSDGRYIDHVVCRDLFGRGCTGEFSCTKTKKKFWFHVRNKNRSQKNVTKHNLCHPQNG
jgi:hypothetical protein